MKKYVFMIERREAGGGPASIELATIRVEPDQ
jgi:hypothetical protein